MNSLSSRRAKIFTLAGCLALTPLAVVSAAPSARATDASYAHAQAAAHFSVFAQPAAAGDALPAGSAYSGGTSRRIAGRARSFSAWAILRGSHLCVTVDAGSGPAAGGPTACNSVRQLTRPGQILILAAGTGSGTAPQILAGLIPDGVSSVMISYANGSTAAVPVHDNGFAVDTGRLVPRSLRLDDGCRDRSPRAGGEVITGHRGAESAASDCAAPAGPVNLAALSPSPAPDYTGEFCYGVLLNDGNTCRSNTESNIRRAICHGSDYTFVSISGDGLSKHGSCSSDGCTADTGYLSRDVTGDGLIENSGPCNCTGYYYGWLYS